MEFNYSIYLHKIQINWHFNKNYYISCEKILVFYLKKMDLTELNEKLKENGIDTSNWGKWSTKDLKSLQNEITKGECKLEVIDWVLTRVVNLVWVDIFHTNKEGVLYNLREIKQVLKDGTENIREFEHSVWEKILWNETPISAMRRWIHDVLSVDNFVDIRKGTQNRLSKASKSYPNLNNLYNRFWFTAKLNNDQFKSKWYTEVKKDKTSYFEWNIIEVEVEEVEK